MKQNLLNKLKIQDKFDVQDMLKQQLDTHKQQLGEIQEALMKKLDCIQKAFDPSGDK